jgi:hypothetical protein
MKISRLQSERQNPSNSEYLSATLPHYTSPVKNGPQNQYGNNRWEVYSPKLRRNVTLYSNLEYDHWVLVESDPEVLFFCEQPLKIKIELPIGTITTIFDMWIQWKSGEEEFREVKFEEELQEISSNSRVCRQIQAQKRWCEIKNKKYSVITEKNIRSNLIYLSNLRLILRHLGSEDIENIKLYSERILLMLLDQGASSLIDIEEIFSDAESLTIRKAVFELIYSGRVITSLDEKPLNMHSKVEVANVGR